MRITNNMIMTNSKSNINSTKELVDKYNTQMTTQKKISKASEDPVVAIRSLRLSTNLSHIDQYVENNIPDAQSWLDVTYTALNNMKKLLTDVHTLCVNGSTDTLTADDRNTILKQLQSYSEQVYSEGDADYAGRTVFTGYRTSSDLTFMKDDPDTTYNIDQTFTYEDMEEHRYYTAGVTVPSEVNTTTPECTTDIKEYSYQRIRMGYGDINGDFTMNISDAAGNVINTYDQSTATVYDTELDFQNALESGEIASSDVIFIRDAGEFVLGKGISGDIASNEYNISVNYTKTGFEASDARPEYYFDCTNETEGLSFTVSDDAIKYTVANNTDITVNTQAKDVLDTSIKRDVDELIDVVSEAIAANAKVDTINQMLKESQYADENSQTILNGYLSAAKQEADYANDNLKKTYSQYQTNFSNYLDKVNLAITNVGSTQKRLDLIQTRVENQQTTIEELKSDNEDRDLSEIIIDYYAIYNAYKSSLTAASKVGEQTLLNYI